MTVDTKGNWRAYWGNGPLPIGFRAIGVVSVDGRTGALLERKSKRHVPVYVCGNAGHLSSLDAVAVVLALRGGAQ